MIFRLDDCSFYYARIWSKSGISICFKHLVKSKKSSNPIFFRKRPILLHTCATCSELPSYISTKIYIYIYIYILSVPKLYCIC